MLIYSMADVKAKSHPHLHITLLLMAQKTYKLKESKRTFAILL